MSKRELWVIILALFGLNLYVLISNSKEPFEPDPSTGHILLENNELNPLDMSSSTMK